MVDKAPAALEVERLGKSFGDIVVLRDISLSIPPGAFLVLVGPSGCGKSTLLNCIAGLEETTTGHVRIDGRDVTDLPPRARDIAMVFQSYALYPTMNVAENIGFGMKIRKLARAEIEARTHSVAELLQIEDLLDRQPSELSGGQRQRVAMGRALVRQPKLFLFDEPLSNLDAKLRVEMRAEIKRLHAATGASIVYVTHDQIEAMTLATQIVVLEGGIVQQAGTPDEIYRAPANTFVATFMGSPPMNLIGATRVAADRLRLDDGQEVPGLALPTALGEGAPVLLGIRPEAFSQGTLLTITPENVENTGSDTFLTFRIGQAQVTARLPWSHAAGAARFGLDFDRAQARFFDAATGKAL